MLLSIIIGLLKSSHQIFMMLVVASLVAMFLVDKKTKKDVNRTAKIVFIVSLILTISVTIIILIKGGTI